MKLNKKEIIDVLQWLEYEYSLTTEYSRRKKGFSELEKSSRIALNKYAKLLKKLGYKSLKDWHERGGILK